jgi:hypothetical protein
MPAFPDGDGDERNGYSCNMGGRSVLRYIKSFPWAQGRQQVCRRPQICGVKALVELAVHQLQQCASILAPALCRHQPCQIDRGAQLTGTPALPAAQLERTNEIGFRLVNMWLRH